MSDGSRPTLTDVASVSGVSAATVSRALARPHMVNRETLARVLSAADSLGYVPAGAARALASGRSKVIGAIVPTLDSAIFSRTLQALQAELAAAGYQLIVASSDYNPAAEAGILRALLAQAVDGLVLVGAERSPEATAILRRAGVPVVLTWCGHPAFDAVTVDNRRAGRLAAEHLVGLGHRAIGVVTGTLAVNDRQRLNSPEAACPAVRLGLLCLVRVAANDSGCHQVGKAGVIDPDLCQQGAVVLAEGWRGRADRARSAAEARHDVMHGKQAHVRIGVIGDDLALDEVRGRRGSARCRRSGRSSPRRLRRTRRSRACVRSAMNAPIMASSSAALRTRSAFVRKRGSSIRSARPMERNRRSAIFWIDPDRLT